MHLDWVLGAVDLPQEGWFANTVIGKDISSLYKGKYWVGRLSPQEGKALGATWHKENNRRRVSQEQPLRKKEKSRELDDNAWRYDVFHLP